MFASDAHQSDIIWYPGKIYCEIRASSVTDLQCGTSRKKRFSPKSNGHYYSTVPDCASYERILTPRFQQQWLRNQQWADHWRITSRCYPDCHSNFTVFSFSHEVTPVDNGVITYDVSLVLHKHLRHIMTPATKPNKGNPAVCFLTIICCETLQLTVLQKAFNYGHFSLFSMILYKALSLDP